MTFLAHIRRHTVLWRDWVAHNRVTGTVAGIMFGLVSIARIAFSGAA